MSDRTPKRPSPDPTASDPPAGSGDVPAVLQADRAVLRLIVSPGAVRSLQQATELLPIADRDARAWLRRRGLVRDLSGRSVVVWADVIAALEAPASSSSLVVRRRRERL